MTLLEPAPDRIVPGGLGRPPVAGHRPRDVAAREVLDPANAAVVLEDRLLQGGLPLLDQRRLHLGLTEARLGLPEHLLLLAARRRIIGRPGELAAEDLRLG